MQRAVTKRSWRWVAALYYILMSNLKYLFRKKRKCVLLIITGVFIFIFFYTQPVISNNGTIKIWDRNNTLLYESAENTGKKIPVSYDRLPEHLIQAALASEDSTFWTNPGVDFRAMLRSLWLNLQYGSIVTGASTITQQLARTSIISPNQIPKRSVIRKLREIIIALRLNTVYPKKDIMTMYFNQMYFGNLAYGIQAAASVYFGKDTSQLSLAESSFLVGLLSSPDRRNPFTNFKEAKEKQEQILALMLKQGFIGKEQAENAKREKLALTKQHTGIKAAHFVHYVREQLEGLDIKASEGINIYTTLDYPSFKLSETIASLWVKKLQGQHDLSNAALVLINNNSGEILSMLGGIDYFDSANAGQVNMTTALRQPGSALKPVTYAAGFMQGYTPATLLYDIKRVFKTQKGEGFSPNDYDGRFRGLVLAREALASSLNIPAVEMLDHVGIFNFLKTARQFGFSTFTQPERYDLSLTLGGGEVKLLELVNSYATFARGGEFKHTYAINKIISDEGKILYSHKDEPGIPVLGKDSKQIAYLISDILSDPKARIPGFGEKNPLVLSHPAAVKTGTTTDWHDNWTVGYTPSYTVGVWVGNNDNHPMQDITGIVGAAPVWNQFFEEFLKGKPVERFIRPDRIKEAEICSLSGKLDDGICPGKKTEIFVEGTEPKQVSQLHKKIRIDIRNNLLAGSACPESFVEERIFVNYPPEVYTWAVQDNQEVIPDRYSSLCTGIQGTSGQTFLEITYPKDKTVFESAPLLVNNQAAVFEANVSGNIKTVQWFVDNRLLKDVRQFPFSVSWPLQTGKHSIRATGITSTNEKITSSPVDISVIEYKGN